VTVASGATLDLNSFSETIGSLSGAGTVTSSVAGALTLTTGGDNTSTLFSGILQNGSGSVAFTKTGTGTLTLSGANTYSGLTTVSAGTLDIRNAAALGTTAGGTTVSNGATLQFQNGITIGAEPLTLNGTGVGGSGALRNFSGNNSIGGAITLASATTINSDAGTFTLGGGIVNAGFTPTFGGAGNISETGVVSGLGGLTKTGSGILTLGGANTYVGTTTINGGTLSVSTNGNLGGLTSAINVNAGTLEIATGFSTARTITLGDAASTFQIDSGQTFTVSTALLGTGTLNKTGAGTMVLSAINLFSGGTNVVAGTLRLGAIDRLLTTSGLTISGGTFDLQTFGQTSGAVTLSSGSITGSGTATLTGSSFTLQSGSVSAILGGNATVVKNTAGSVTLSGANTFTGSTTISVGTLQVNSNNALGTAASGTTVANGAVLNLNNVNYTTAEPLTLNGVGLANGALLNTGTSTFAGPINAATNATINAGGGTLNLTGGLSKNGTTLTIAGGGTVNITTNGITGSAANSDLVVDGTTVVLGAASSYNGPTTIQNAGTLKLGNSNVLPTSPQTAMTVNTNSIFDLASYSDGVASLTGDTTAIVKNSVVGGTSALTVNPSVGVSTTFAGTIKGTTGGTQGDIALVKNGSGTLILTGANTYGGSTTINGGTVTLAATSGSAAGSTGSITVNSGGTLALGNGDQINNTAPMTLAGGTFSKGDFSEGTASSPGLGALTLTAAGSPIDFGSGSVGILTFASFTPGSYALTVANWTGTAGTVGNGSTDRLIFASDQTANLSSFSFNGYAGAMEIALPGGYYEVVPMTAVPEASTWIAAGLALVPVGFKVLRRRRPTSS
jgi:autotransporter-associated beta strand protein